MGAYDKMSDEDLCFKCDRPLDKCLCNNTMKFFSDEELKQELTRRLLEKTSKKYKGFLIKTEIHTKVASIYNLNGKYIKVLQANTLDQALKLAIQYIDEVVQARNQLNKLRKQEQKLSNKIKEIQDNIYDIEEFLNGV